MNRLLFGLLMFAGVSAHAIDFNISREESGLAKYFFDGITASTSVILIDLSDNSNFPHAQTGYVNITNLRVNVDKVAASTMTIKMGVVYEVNATSGSVRWFYSKILDLDTVGTHQVEELNFAPGVIRAYVNSSGGTPFIISNDRTAESTVYQTDVVLPIPTGGSVAPAVGDIIARVDYEGGAAASDLTIESLYFTKR